MKKWKSTLIVASATLGMFFAFGSSVRDVLCLWQQR
ncbi:hypothetical protein NB22_07920 [Limosilactobacillus fermentum NB-22]|uniref:Uncharacterized protein n=1 Tax=Limosilactobacillus fermentum NB-22 TaxID=1408443 RepID=A0A829LT17_LIMFE|nr:hypothetical protein NB22_07920 [Limosilactobacillus fermentum NB-22]